MALNSIVSRPFVMSHAYGALTLQRPAWTLTGFASRLPSTDRSKYIYARVNASHQKKKLEAQVKALSLIYPHHAVVKDIASGHTIHRQGLQYLLERTRRGHVTEIVALDRDVLSVTSYDFIDWFMRANHVQLVIYQLPWWVLTNQRP